MNFSDVAQGDRRQKMVQRQLEIAKEQGERLAALKKERENMENEKNAILGKITRMHNAEPSEVSKSSGSWSMRNFPDRRRQQPPGGSPTCVAGEAGSHDQKGTFWSSERDE